MYIDVLSITIVVDAVVSLVPTPVCLVGSENWIEVGRDIVEFDGMPVIGRLGPISKGT